MSIANIKETLLWCSVINYGLLIFWCLTVILKWNWLYDLCARIFQVPRERVNAVNYAGICYYKIAIILFNLVPLIAICIATAR